MLYATASVTRSCPFFFSHCLTFATAIGWQRQGPLDRSGYKIRGGHQENALVSGTETYMRFKPGADAYIRLRTLCRYLHAPPEIGDRKGGFSPKKSLDIRLDSYVHGAALRTVAQSPLMHTVRCCIIRPPQEHHSTTSKTRFAPV